MKFFAWIALALLSGQTQAAENLPRLMSEVLSYSCKFQFPEGEGVSTESISCLPNQHLGLYQADYKFYLYRSNLSSNIPARGTSQVYPPICGATIQRFVCETIQPHKEFGLSARAEGIFQIAISLTPAPHAGPQLVGFAAMPNSQGTCPEGLVKIRPYYATPGSMIDPLPSTFINRNGSLNSAQVGASQPEPFAIIRVPGETPCDSQGHCRAPNGTPYKAAEAAFAAASPVVCAVPASAL